MGAVGGTALRLLSTTLYILCLLCGIVILGLYSYFLAAESTRHVSGPNWVRAVEGIAGIGVVYCLLAVVLTCCLGGFMIFAFLGIVFNVVLGAGFIAIAIMAKGSGSCDGFVKTPLGNGQAASHKGWDNATFNVSLGTACRLNKAVLAVAIIGAFLFFISAFVQLWLGRHHQREKRYGPSPANNYTRGNGIKFFKRRRGAKSAHAAATKDAETGLAPAPVMEHDATPDPRYNTPAMNAYTGNKYEPTQTHPTSDIPVAGGYHTAPTGSAVNPYGYDSRPAQRY